MKLSELAPADLRACSTWELRTRSAVDGEVVPAHSAQLSESDARIFVASTQFAFADGSTGAGYCSPTDDSGLDYVQPVAFLAGEQVALWRHPLPSRSELEALWARFGRRLPEVYPIKYRCLVPVDGAERTGVILLTDAARVAG